jgi:hypothetical protein
VQATKTNQEKQDMKNQNTNATVQEKRNNPQLRHSEKLGLTLLATIRVECHPSDSVTTRAPSFRCAVLFRDEVVAQFKPTRSTTERTRKGLIKKATEFISEAARANDCSAIAVYEESLFNHLDPAKMATTYILGAYAPAGVWLPTFEN